MPVDGQTPASERADGAPAVQIEDPERPLAFGVLAQMPGRTEPEGAAETAFGVVPGVVPLAHSRIKGRGQY